jgi:crotonobetainyl-CoA:carnitine CoA-transferase CaiB-like acyl-CoA transferase
MAGVLLDSHWKRLARRIGRPELADDPRYREAAGRIERRSEVDALLADWAAGRSVEDFVAAFAEDGIPAAPVRSYAEAAADPHVRERDMLQTVAASQGEVAVVGPAAKLSRTPTRVRTPAPSLGQHDHEIRAELLDAINAEGLGETSDDD